MRLTKSGGATIGALLASTALSFPAAAQSVSSITAAPQVAVESPGGVDMASGRYRDESQDLAIGPDGGGIRYSRINARVGPFGTNWNTFIKITVTMGQAEIYYSIESRGVSKSYVTYDGVQFFDTGMAGGGAESITRVAEGSGYRMTYTAPDGTTTRFEPTANGGDAVADLITRPDGVTYSLSYDNGGVSPRARRLRRVQSNRGYELILEYGGINGSNKITKACAFSAAAVLPPAAHVCPSGAQSASYTYSGDHLASATNAGGATTTMSRTITNSVPVVAITMPGASQPQVTNTYGGLGSAVSQQTFADGRTFAYTYEELGQIPPDGQITFPWPRIRGTGWTENGQAATGLAWSWYQQYSETPLYISPAPTLVTDPLGRSTANSFGGGSPGQPYRQLASRTLPSGRVESFAYDANSSMTQRSWAAPAANPAPTLTQTFTYNCAASPALCGKPVTATDARGNVTDYTYAPHGGMLTETAPAGPNGVRPQKRYAYVQASARYYNSSGTLVQGAPVYLLSSISQCNTLASCAGTADEVVTSFTYPTGASANNLLPVSQTVTAAGLTATTAWTYDANGDKLTEDGPLPGTADTTRWRYDAMRRVVGVASPDPDGTGPLPHRAVRNTYDIGGRLTKVENGTVTDQGDTAWAAFSATDSVETVYDVMDRKVRVSRVAGGVTHAVTQMSYDSRGRLECTATRMNPAAYGSLPASACTLGTQGSEGPDRITRNSYDAAGQLLQVTEGYGTSIQANEATYSYTANGQKASVTDGNGNRAELRYDGHDRQTRWVFPSATTAGVVNEADYESYAYDNNSNRTSLRKRDGQVIGYTYDALNRVTVKDLPGTAADVAYGYDLRGLQLYARFGSAMGEGITNDYDGLGRLTSTLTTMDGTNRTISYEYDAAGSRTRVTHPDGMFFTYEHDVAGRLTTIRENGAGSLVGFTYNAQGRPQNRTERHGSGVGYEFDTVGRLASIADTFVGGVGNVTLGFNYNPASQVTTHSRSNTAYSWTGAYNINRGYSVNGLNQYTAAGTAAFTYDANGNLTSDGSSTFTYDTENRLLTASGARTAALRYDPLGRLYEVSGNAGTTKFLYDGDALVAEYNTAGAITARYLHGRDAKADDPLIWYDGGTARWLHSDHQGSVVAATNGAGGSPTINTYDEYGIPGTTNQGRFQYTGQAWLPELGMYYYKARVYSPTLGRFLQMDPIGYDDQINLYAYVGNDPLNVLDPTGTRGATNGEERMLRRVFGGQMAIVPVYRFPISRSVVFPYEIDFASHAYSTDYSRERDSAKLSEFWHEQYHLFEISIGYKTWTSMAYEQAMSGFGSDIYSWDPSKSFNSQTFEARASAFGTCMSGGGCGRLEGMSIGGSGTTLSFRNGEFTLTQVQTGSRIRTQTKFKPGDIVPKPK